MKKENMTLQVVRRIAEERDNSQLVPSKPRTELQRIRLNGLYELLVVLRVVLTLNLQTGWIHQDELSNSIEVVAGDYFDLQVFKPGCFNTSFPTHSMAILHTTIYLPYLLTSYFLSYEHSVGKERIPNSKLLLLIPRLFQLIISFLVDYILMRFCILNDPSKKKEVEDVKEETIEKEENPATPPPPTTEATTETRRRRRRRRTEIPEVDSSDSDTNPPEDETGRHRRRRRARNESNTASSPSSNEAKTESNISTCNDYSIRLVTLGSSQVMLIFATRTHPSALNILLFALLLYLVSASFHSYEEYITLLEKYHKLPKYDSLGKVDHLKKMKKTGYGPTNRLAYITFVTVVGIFNDPEFFFSYACIPLFFFMQRGISHRHVGMKYFHARIFTFMFYFFVFCIPFVLWDSFYYERVTLWDFLELNLTPESFVVTPVNYFASKESQFRDIWGYAKILILYLVVFNILGMMGLVSFVKELYDVMFAEWRNKPNMDSHWTFLNCSLFLPLFFLIQAHGNSYSVFDLAPLIFPLVYMHGHKIPLISRFSGKIGFLWFASNCLGILFFGYLNQGGIITSFLDLYDNLTPIRFNDTQVDITFSQMTAIPPTFTLAIPYKWKTRLPTTSPDLDFDLPQGETYSSEELNGFPPLLHKTVLTLEQSSKLRVYHTGHSPLPMSHLERDLHRLVNNQEQLRQKKKTGETISFLLIPYIYAKESEESFRLLKLTHIKTYWNHVFMQLFPDSDVETAPSLGGYLMNIFNRNSLHCGLSLYRMEKVELKADGAQKPLKVTNNDTKTKKMEETFYKYFQFHDAFCDFLKYIFNFVTLILTLGLFLTSFLVYLT